MAPIKNEEWGSGCWMLYGAPPPIPSIHHSITPFSPSYYECFVHMVNPSRLPGGALRNKLIP